MFQQFNSHNFAVGCQPITILNFCKQSSYVCFVSTFECQSDFVCSLGRLSQRTRRQITYYLVENMIPNTIFDNIYKIYVFKHGANTKRRCPNEIFE